MGDARRVLSTRVAVLACCFGGATGLLVRDKLLDGVLSLMAVWTVYLIGLSLVFAAASVRDDEK